MRILFLASSTLVITAGLANAQALSLSGEARLGVIGDDAGGAWVWSQDDQLDLDFTVAIEADQGFRFGAWTRVEAASGRAGVFSGSHVWAEAGNLRVTFGNADGALTHSGYLGGGGVGYEGGILNGDAAGLDAIAQEAVTTGGGAANALRVDIAVGTAVVSVSHERGAATEIGAQAVYGQVTVAAGYSSAGTGSWALSGQFDGGDWGVGVLLASVDGSENWVVSGSRTLGKSDLYGYVGEVGSARAYGLGYSYDLGGAVRLTLGAERVASVAGASLGVAFAF